MLHCNLIKKIITEKKGIFSHFIHMIWTKNFSVKLCILYFDSPGIPQLFFCLKISDGQVIIWGLSESRFDYLGSEKIA